MQDWQAEFCLLDRDAQALGSALSNDFNDRRLAAPGEKVETLFASAGNAEVEAARIQNVAFHPGVHEGVQLHRSAG